MLAIGPVSGVQAAPVGASSFGSARLERIEWLHDRSGQLHIGDVVAAASSGRFQRVHQAKSVGLRQGTVWLRLTVSGSLASSSHRWLLLNSPLLLEAQLYSPSATGFEASATLGLRGAAQERIFPVRPPVFDIDPAPGQVQIYYVRLRSDVMIWLDPRLLKTAELVGWYQQSQLLLGVLIACHVLLLLSSAWFARHAQEPSYGWLAALTCANLLFTLGLESALLQMMLPTRGAWFMPLISAVWMVRVPLAGAFVLSHLRMNRHRLARGYLLTLSAVALAGWLQSVGGGPQLWVSWYQSWAAAQVCLFLLLAGYATLRDTRGAAILMLAFLPVLVGAFHSMSGIQDGQPLTPWTRNAVRFGFAAFLIVMQYAAFRRHRDLRLAYEHAQADALEASRTAERTLEGRVTDRTRQLNAALTAARSALAAEEQARMEQRQFFLTMQHELRTPLAVIDAANRNLQRDLPADCESGQLRCERIGRAVDQLNKLLTSSLVLKRLDASPTSPPPTLTELRPLIQEARDAARLLSPGHALVLELDTLPQHWICEPALTVLALRTLAVNAVKYTPVGTTVTIRGSSDARGLSLEVHDNGPGVSAEDLPRLFERFFRASNASAIPGTGLGLPLARKMIEMQGGRLDVESIEHEGFTATIWLPLRPNLAQQVRPPPAASPAVRPD